MSKTNATMGNEKENVFSSFEEKNAEARERLANQQISELIESLFEALAHSDNADEVGGNIRSLLRLLPADTVEHLLLELLLEKRITRSELFEKLHRNLNVCEGSYIERFHSLADYKTFDSLPQKRLLDPNPDLRVLYNQMVENLTRFLVPLRNWKISSEDFSYAKDELISIMKNSPRFTYFRKFFVNIDSRFDTLNHAVQRYNLYDITRGQMLSCFEEFFQFLVSFPTYSPLNFDKT